MKTTIQDAIDALSDSEIRDLINDFELFERDTTIGDCKLRSLAETMPGSKYHVCIFMNAIAFKCYKHFANKYLEEIDSD